MPWSHQPEHHPAPTSEMVHEESENETICYKHDGLEY